MFLLLKISMGIFKKRLVYLFSLLTVSLGAAIVALMGGIFFGGNALIIIFVIILSLNTVLIWQISKLKNYFLTTGSSY
jgi:hypothetical protein